MPKAQFKTRRGLRLRSPSPYELKPEQSKAAVVALISARKPRRYPSKETRLRYQLARSRLGLSPNAVGSLNWGRINTRTTFIWKHESLPETARWMIAQTYASMHKHPIADRVSIALHYASRAFGIMNSDILDDQRSPVLVIARYIAMVCVRRSGVGRNDTARRFNRDQTVVKLAERKVSKYFEGIEYGFPNVEPTSDLGPPLDGQSSGAISP